ncbi:MAG: hypothetical protein WC732_09725 [Candidatus Omnitrophota bacterium]
MEKNAIPRTATQRGRVQLNNARQHHPENNEKMATRPIVYDDDGAMVTIRGQVATSRSVAVGFRAQIRMPLSFTMAGTIFGEVKVDDPDSADATAVNNAYATAWLMLMADLFGKAYVSPARLDVGVHLVGYYPLDRTVNPKFANREGIFTVVRVDANAAGIPGGLYMAMTNETGLLNAWEFDRAANPMFMPGTNVYMFQVDSGDVGLFARIADIRPMRGVRLSEAEEEEEEVEEEEVEEEEEEEEEEEGETSPEEGEVEGRMRAIALPAEPEEEESEGEEEEEEEEEREPYVDDPVSVRQIAFAEKKGDALEDVEDEEEEEEEEEEEFEEL